MMMTMMMMMMVVISALHSCHIAIGADRSHRERIQYKEHRGRPDKTVPQATPTQLHILVTDLSTVKNCNCKYSVTTT
jgi:hypothetical protein